MEILCSLRLVLAGIASIEIPESSRLEFLQKFSANNFALSDAEDNTSGLYSRFTFAESTIGSSPKLPRARFLESDGLFCFISVCNFGSFKNPFATIASLSELYFRFRRFYPFGTNERSDFYELPQQIKQLKTMEMSES